MSSISISIFDTIPQLSQANNVHLIFNMPLAKLYSNCLMSSLNARRQWGGTSYTSEGRTSGKREMRAAIHVTTTTAQETFEMDPRGGAFDGTVTIGGTGVTDTKRKIMDDGLSLRSDSIEGFEDNDGFNSRQKLADEETPPPLTPSSVSDQVPAEVPTLPAQLPQPHYKPSRVKLQAPLPTGGRGPPPGSNNNNNNNNNNTRNTYLGVSNSPVPPPIARGGRNEVNIEWSKEL